MEAYFALREYAVSSYASGLPASDCFLLRVRWVSTALASSIGTQFLDDSILSLFLL